MKPILKVDACFFSFSSFSLFDPKLKHRPCGSTSWFISILSDWPFVDFLVLLCSKIGLFGCPHAVLIPCSVNSTTNYRKLQCKQVFQGSELKKRAALTPFLHFQELWPQFYLWVITELLDQSMCKLLFPLKWAPIEGGGRQRPGELMTAMQIP